MSKKLDVTTGKAVNYEYDSLGRLIHSYQTDNGTIQRHTEHLYDTENRLVSQTWTSGGENHVMDFIYDNTGKPYAVKYDNQIFYYVLNLQGDVIAIITHWGETYGTYTYDAWGNVIAQSGSIASLNPIRYRGYYYDAETGLYYLGSRYYDPAVKRFINADGAALATINPYSNGLTDKNYFAYCDNNPVSRNDDGGEFWGSVVASAVLGGVTSAFDAVIAGESTTGVIKAAAKGAASGAISGAIGGILTVAKAPTIIKAVASATYSAATNIYNQKKTNPNAKIDWYSVTTSVGTSLISTTVSTANGRIASSATRGLSKASKRVVKYVMSGIKNMAIYTYNLAFRSIRKMLRGQTA